MQLFTSLLFYVSFICIQSNNILAMHQEDPAETAVKKTIQAVLLLKSEPLSKRDIPKSMAHYVAKMDSYMKTKFKNIPTATYDELDNAFTEGDSLYCRQLPPTMLMTINLAFNLQDRIIFNMHRYTEPT